MAVKRRKREVWESLPHTHRIFRPYTTALGEIALALNGLQSELCLLFVTMMGGGYANQFLAIWHALKNDGAQRDILVAAATEARQNREYEDDFGKTVLADIQWLCGQAREISDKRDTALHSPLWGYPGTPGMVVPMTGLGHVRARKLMDAAAKRGLLAEFRWCRDAFYVLTDYAKEMHNILTGRIQRPWPNRPSLPNRGQTSADQPRRQVQKAKRTRQRKSSPLKSRV